MGCISLKIKTKRKMVEILKIVKAIYFISLLLTGICIVLAVQYHRKNKDNE